MVKMFHFCHLCAYILYSSLYCIYYRYHVKFGMKSNVIFLFLCNISMFKNNWTHASLLNLYNINVAIMTYDSLQRWELPVYWPDSIELCIELYFFPNQKLFYLDVHHNKEENTNFCFMLTLMYCTTLLKWLKTSQGSLPKWPVGICLVLKLWIYICSPADLLSFLLYNFLL